MNRSQTDQEAGNSTPADCRFLLERLMPGSTDPRSTLCLLNNLLLMEAGKFLADPDFPSSQSSGFWSDLADRVDAFRPTRTKLNGSREQFLAAYLWGIQTAFPDSNFADFLLGKSENFALKDVVTLNFLHFLFNFCHFGLKNSTLRPRCIRILGHLYQQLPSAGDNGDAQFRTSKLPFQILFAQFHVEAGNPEAAKDILAHALEEKFRVAWTGYYILGAQLMVSICETKGDFRAAEKWRKTSATMAEELSMPAGWVSAPLLMTPNYVAAFEDFVHLEG